MEWHNSISPRPKDARWVRRNHLHVDLPFKYPEDLSQKVCTSKTQSTLNIKTQSTLLSRDSWNTLKEGHGCETKHQEQRGGVLDRGNALYYTGMWRDERHRTTETQEEVDQVPSYSADDDLCSVVLSNPFLPIAGYKFTLNWTTAQRPDLRSQINKASALSECLRDIVWSNPCVRTNSKIRIYMTCIRPTMTYGIKVREDTNKTKSMLRVIEMKTQNNNGENKERESEKHRHQKTMRNTRHSEMEKAA